MDFRKSFFLALIASGIAACDASSSSEPASTVPASVNSMQSTQPAEEGATSMIAELEGRLKKGMPYAELRKAVMDEGWEPVTDPECKTKVGGEASICDELPELESCSGDGHCAMNFKHSAEAVNLRVTTYGENDDWNVTGPESTLAVMGWSFSGATQDRVGLSDKASEVTMDNDALLPADACTLAGHGAFLESFVQSEKVRAMYTARQVQIRDPRDSGKPARLVDKEQYNQFKIGLMDYRWVHLDPATNENSHQRLDVKQTLAGNTLRVEYVKAEFDSEENLVRTIGTPRVYIFEFEKGCWYLTQDLQ